ncbi:MAG: hypothetical protein JNL38_00620 [Myxococcales bacterium]|nr:hypothetical protein [Myxococcales bacterium]
MRGSSLVSKVAVVGALGAVTLGLCLWPKKSAPPERAAEHAAGPRVEATDGEDEKSPRLLLGRLWLDKLPAKRTDTVDLWIFFAGGIGLEDKGSSFRSTLEIFELERQGSRLDIVFLQDQKKQTVKFAVKSCSDKPEFDLCLELTPPVRGVSKLYGWGDDEEMDRAMPWGREWRKAAEVKARAAKP